ncbi:MAG: site-specific DNA-methyltransferase [Candidatus Kuenenia sp.]|nr:site-specific DNA-methyltransferase [Candidatus Kuenenia hertensis]
MDRKSLNITEEKLNKLKEIIPEAFTENKIDWEKLKAALGENIEFKNERYVLNWAGKSDAFRVLQSPTTATLAPCKKESVNFDATENIFIEGENLEVLKILQKSYFGKIKMIYIDPPYNTGNDTFIYPDKFSETKEGYLSRIGDKDESGYMTREGLFRKNSKDSGHFHSNWLSMMYPRLFLARNLLKDDGVIFVSIDDNEVHKIKEEQKGKLNFDGNTVKQDLGFKVFKLCESNFKIWRTNIEDEGQLVKQLQLHLDPLDKNARTEGVLYELLLKSGVSLTAKIEEKDGFYLVNSNEIAMVLEKIDKDIIKTVIEVKPKKVITLDRLFNKNDQLKTNTALQMKDAGIEFKVV